MKGRGNSLPSVGMSQILEARGSRGFGEWDSTGTNWTLSEKYEVLEGKLGGMVPKGGLDVKLPSKFLSTKDLSQVTI